MEPTLPKTTAAQALVDQLIVNGIDHVFCVPGESFLSVLDAIYERKLPLTVCRNEAGAAMMADAYGKATGKPGICFVTRGPGAANAFVGVIFLIFSTQIAQGTAHVGYNISTWYVDPHHCAYASLLVASAVRYKDVTYVNISPAIHTWPIIEAQGFKCYCSGGIIAIPALSRPVPNTQVHEFDTGRDYGPALSKLPQFSALNQFSLRARKSSAKY